MRKVEGGGRGGESRVRVGETSRKEEDKSCQRGRKGGSREEEG